MRTLGSSPRIVVLVAGCAAHASPIGSSSPPARRAAEPAPRDTAPASPPSSPSSPSLPALTIGHLGALSGDTVFDRDVIAAALPELAWTELRAPAEVRLVGALDDRPVVVVQGRRFIDSITVVSPRIATAVGAAIGEPFEHTLHDRFHICTAELDVLAVPVETRTDCFANDGVTVWLDGVAGGRDLDGRHVVAVSTGGLSTGDDTDAAMARPAPAIAADPVVAASALRVDRDAIHPITDLKRIDAAALARALPRLDVAATAGGFAISHAGVKVADVVVTDGTLARVAVLHPSVRHGLAVVIGQPVASADAATKQLLETTACTTAPDKRTATCAPTELPHIELAVAANLGLPHNFSIADHYDDVRVTAIAWVPPRMPQAWPTIDAGGVGGLTVAIVGIMDVYRAREVLLRDFDVLGPAISNANIISAYAGGAKVLDLAQDSTVTVFDPRVKLAGTDVGVGSTIGDVTAAGLAPSCTRERVDEAEVDVCRLADKRVSLMLRAGRGDLGKRVIATMRWDAP